MSKFFIVLNGTETLTELLDALGKAAIAELPVLLDFWQNRVENETRPGRQFRFRQIVTAIEREIDHRQAYCIVA